MQDDTVLDVIDEFKDYLKVNQCVIDSTKKLIENNQELIDDEDEGPLFWIALGKCQWEYGKIDQDILKIITDNFNKDKGLAIWKEESESDYKKRKKVIFDFIQKISQSNPKQKRMPKLIVRKPLFIDGDCLSLHVNQKYYAAALAVQTDESNLEYGSNLVAILDYWSTKQPSLEIFKNPKFLKLTYGNWNGAYLTTWITRLGFNSFKNKVVLIGNTDVSQIKDMDDRSYSSWNFIFNCIEKQKRVIES